MRRRSGAGSRMSFASFNGHRAHDCVLLARRWAALARRAGLGWRRFATAGELSGACRRIARLRGATGGQPSIFPPECTATRRPRPGDCSNGRRPMWRLLRAHRFLIFPCLNPHGHRPQHARGSARRGPQPHLPRPDREPLIAAWRKVIGERELSLALCLHEDYDAQGCYVYELRRRPGAVGPKALRDCARIIPPDTAAKNRRARHEERALPASRRLCAAGPAGECRRRSCCTSLARRSR